MMTLHFHLQLKFKYELFHIYFTSRCFQFLRFCHEDEEELTFHVVDLCSPNLFKLINYLQDECKLGHGGHLGYKECFS